MMKKKKSASALISDLKRKTRKAYSSEDKIRVIIEGMRGETTIAELCRKEGIHQANYYKWSKDFMEAGKHRLQGDTLREAPMALSNSSARNSNPSLLEITNSSNFTLYPNPTNNQVNISWNQLKEGRVKITIYDVLGKEIYNNNTFKLERKQQINIDISDFENGIYFIKFETNQKSETQQLIKTN